MPVPRVTGSITGAIVDDEVANHGPGADAHVVLMLQTGLTRFRRPVGERSMRPGALASRGQAGLGRAKRPPVAEFFVEDEGPSHQKLDVRSGRQP